MEKKRLMIPWISLSGILMGMVFNFCSSFQCPAEYKRIIFPVILIAAVTLICIVPFRRKYAIILSGVLSFGIVAFCAISFERLKTDFFVIAQYVDCSIEKYNGSRLFNLEEVAAEMTPIEVNLFFYLILLISAGLISFFLFRCYKGVFGLFPVYAVTALGLLVGQAPNFMAVTCFVAGAALAWLWISRQDRGGNRFFLQKNVIKKKSIPVYLIFLCILISGLFVAKQITGKNEAAILEKSDEYLKKQHQLEDDFKMMAENISKYLLLGFSGESDGILDNDEPHYTDSVVMKVTMQKKPSSAIYLKGFIGTEYKNGQWFAREDDVFSEIAYDDEVLTDIWNCNYSFFSVYVPDEVFIEDDEESWNPYHLAQALIEYVGRGKFTKYAYMPYFADLYTVFGEDAEEVLKLDGENGIQRKENSYYVNFYPIDSACYGMVADKINDSWYLEDDFEENDTTQLGVNAREEYYSYVKRIYSRYPDGLSGLKKFIQDYEVAGTRGLDAVDRVAALEAGQDIADILAQQAVYSLVLEPLPEGEDYAEYFLLQQKKGYCEHFATAGTLLLRAKGLPARFVQGYRVTPDMFEKNDDGTYTAKILDSDAHAWSEVYEGKYAGWFPIEMTPSGIRNNLVTSAPVSETTPEGQVIMDEETPEMVETEKPAVSPELTKKPKTEKKENEPETKKRKNVQQFGTSRLLTAGVLVFLLLPVLFVFKKRREVYSRSREFKAMDGNGKMQVSIREEELLHFLKNCGQRGVMKQNEEMWCAKLSVLCGMQYNTEKWKEFKRIMQKAAFSKENITKAEVLYYCNMAENIELLVWQGLGKLRKVYLWAVGYKKML